MEAGKSDSTEVSEVPFADLSAEEQQEYLPYRGNVLPADDRLPLVTDADFDPEVYLAQLECNDTLRNAHGNRRANLEDAAAKDETDLKEVPCTCEGPETAENIEAHMYANVRLRSGMRTALVDKSTKSTWVSKAFYLENAQSAYLPDVGKAEDDNAALGVVGCGLLTIEFWGRRIDILVRVAKNVPGGILLGQDFLQRQQIICDPGAKRGRFVKTVRGTSREFSGKLYPCHATSKHDETCIAQIHLEDAASSMPLYSSLFFTTTADDEPTENTYAEDSMTSRTGDTTVRSRDRQHYRGQRSPPRDAPSWLFRRCQRRSVHKPTVDPNVRLQQDCVRSENALKYRGNAVHNGIYHVTDDAGIFHVREPSGSGLSAVLDIGAAKSVVGIKQARRIARESGRPLQYLKSVRRFKFGEQVVPSIALCPVDIPTPSGILSVVVDVVDLGVPLLFGLDLLDRHRLQVLTLSNELQHIPVGLGRSWTLPCVRRSGHVHLPFSSPTKAQRLHYTESELKRLHRHLHHPSARKLHDLLRRADPGNLPSDTKETLEKISGRCKACQRHAPAPLSFRVRFPDEVIFNREIRLDLMYVEERRPVLHVIDSGTSFQSATFLEGEDAVSVWNGLVKCWTRLYVGDPEKILTDQGSAFTSAVFTDSCIEHGIQLRHTGTEQHNSLGAGESYHAPLRRVYMKLRSEFPGVPLDVALQCAVYAMNTTAGPNGLVPCLLVFGCFPRLPFVKGTQAINNEKRFAMMTAARTEYSTCIAQLRVRLGLKSYVTPAADYSYSPGDNVYVWRETGKVWTGPHEVVSIRDKEIIVQIDQHLAPFNVAKTKPALIPYNVNWTEILKDGDPRIESTEMHEAVKKELDGLFRKGTFRIVVLSDEEKHRENVLPSRFVFAIKTENGETVYKARFVLGGHKDKLKRNIVHTAASLSQSSVRILLALASIFGFDVWTTDVCQAYLQSASLLRRAVFLKPDGIDLHANEYLQLLLPLYGLSEAGDYWSKTLTEHCINDCNFKQTKSDLSFFFKRAGNRLLGLSANYVDDLLRAAPPELRADMDKCLRERFQCKKTQSLPAEFLGLNLRTTLKGFAADMSAYISRLDLLPNNATFEQFSSFRAMLLWVSNVRPDIAAFVSIISSLTKETFEADRDVRLMNNMLIMLKKTKDIGLSFPPLDVNSLRLVTYTDGSFANRSDSSSQIGFLSVLMDCNGHFAVINYRSCKAWRVCRSAMASETLAFTEGFDSTFTIRSQLSDILDRHLPIIMLTDSKTLFDIMTSQKKTTEARLMIDIFAARQSYQRGEIDNIGLIRSDVNLADDLTKLNGNGALLRALMLGRIRHEVEDYIFRPSV